VTYFTVTKRRILHKSSSGERALAALARASTSWREVTVGVSDTLDIGHSSVGTALAEHGLAPIGGLQMPLTETVYALHTQCDFPCSLVCSSNVITGG